MLGKDHRPAARAHRKQTLRGHDAPRCQSCRGEPMTNAPTLVQRQRRAVQIDRRSFLRYVGAGATGLTVSHLLGPLGRAAIGDAATSSGVARGAWDSAAGGTTAWRPVSYPVPIPGDGGSAKTDPMRLARYEVRDDLLLPDGFSYNVLAQWGDLF